MIIAIKELIRQGPLLQRQRQSDSAPRSNEVRAPSSWQEAVLMLACQAGDSVRHVDWEKKKQQRS